MSFQILRGSGWEEKHCPKTKGLGKLWFLLVFWILNTYNKFSISLCSAGQLSLLKKNQVPPTLFRFSAILSWRSISYTELLQNTFWVGFFILQRMSIFDTYMRTTFQFVFLCWKNVLSQNNKRNDRNSFEIFSWLGIKKFEFLQSLLQNNWHINLKDAKYAGVRIWRLWCFPTIITQSVTRVNHNLHLFIYNGD